MSRAGVIVTPMIVGDPCEALVGHLRRGEPGSPFMFDYDVSVKSGDGRDDGLVFVNSIPLFDSWEKGMEKEDYDMLWEGGENSEYTVYFWVSWLRFVVKEFGGGMRKEGDEGDYGEDDESEEGGAGGKMVMER